MLPSSTEREKEEEVAMNWLPGDKHDETTAKAKDMLPWLYIDAAQESKNS